MSKSDNRGLCIAKTQFTHEKVLFTYKLWPTPLPTNIVTPNRLYTSLPAPTYIICTLFVSLAVFIYYQWSNYGGARGGLAHLERPGGPRETSVLRGFKGACKRPPEIAR